MRTTTLAGAVVAGVLLCVADAESSPHRGYECDEWRDYLFNAETGDFIEWVGKPYWVCKDLGAPVSYPDPPRSPDGPDYGGGYGYPHKPSRQEQCARCEARLEQCIDGLAQGVARCMRHYERIYHGWCVEHKRLRNGSWPRGKINCWTERDHRGKPMRQCNGPGITECIQSYAVDGSSTTTGANAGLSIKLTDFFTLNVGRNESRTITFPPGTGFTARCRQAMEAAGEVCINKNETCTMQAGGCR